MRSAAALVLLAAAACGGGGGGAQVATSDTPRTVLQIRSSTDGKVLRQIELAARAGATEPVLAGDVVLVTTREGLLAVDLDTGQRRWTQPRAQLPAAIVGDVVVINTVGSLTARRTDGTVLWERPTGAKLVQAWEGQGVLLLDDGSPPGGSCGTPATPCVPRPAARRGTVALLDPQTGKARWTTPLDCRPEPNSSAVSATHALVGCGADDGSSRLTALALADGKIAWTWSAATALESVVASGGIPAVTVADEARGLDPATGRERWRAGTGSFPIRGAPLLDSDGRVGFLRDPATGTRSKGDVAFSYGLATHAGVLLGADPTTLRVVRADDGRAVWSSALVTGVRPITFLDADADHVVSITSVGQEEYRD